MHAAPKRCCTVSPTGTAPIALCRTAMRRGVSPSLAAALQGVTHVKLFLGGQVVRKGLPVHKLAEDAALAGLSLVLPSGQVLGLAAEPAPAVRL